MTPSVMIDIEAMSLSPCAAITSIGAVLFDPHGDWIGDSFHIDLSLKDSIRAGLHLDAETILWWIGQDGEARHGIIIGQQDPAPLYVGLEAFCAWMPKDAEVWAKQASYDFAALRHACTTVGLRAPWNHRKEVCMRKLLANYTGPNLPENTGRPHHALDDAYHQARLVQAIHSWSQA